MWKQFIHVLSHSLNIFKFNQEAIEQEPNPNQFETALQAIIEQVRNSPNEPKSDYCCPLCHKKTISLVFTLRQNQSMSINIRCKHCGPKMQLHIRSTASKAPIWLQRRAKDTPTHS